VTAESPEPRKARVNQSFTAFEAVQEAATEPQQPQGPADSAPATAGAAAQPVAETPTAAASQAAQADPKTTEPISYWELPQGIRDSLPDLRITVLVYAESPENRFVLVGGQRLAEKDPYQEGVVLEEIRREGAVFLYRNYRFLVEG
jgi:general secretion pathway protein B